MNPSFAELFKKYRLKSEFSRLSDLGMALAEKGFIYDDSIFSHWQKGTRVPNNRELLLSLIQIFSERKALHSIDEANILMASTQQGYLTEKEIQKISLPSKSFSHIPFQVPQQIAYFTGREKIIETLRKKIVHGGAFLLHGSSGIGKTALAIQLGHLLRKKFPDGILWYKVDTTNPMDVLLSIAQLFGENISRIQDIEVRASVVRSLLAYKKVLLILDNVEHDTNVSIFIPNSLSSVLLTSKQKNISLDSAYESFSLDEFTQEEGLSLFSQILSESYVTKSQESLLELGKRVGNLPLALHMYAKQLLTKQQTPKVLLQQIEKSKVALQELLYENKNLYISIDFSFRSLDETTKKVFLSFGIFAGNDFSFDAIKAINNLSLHDTFVIVEKLMNASLLEKSTKNRYRLHPLIRQYIAMHGNTNIFFIPAAKYYVTFFEKNKRKDIKFYKVSIIYQELENIEKILKKCYQIKAYKEFIGLWKHLGEFLFQTGDWAKAIKFGELGYKATQITKDYYSHVIYSLSLLSRIHYLQGNPDISKNLTSEALQIAESLQDEFLIAFTKQQQGKIYQAFGKWEVSLELLLDTENFFNKLSLIDSEILTYNYKFMGESYMFLKNWKQAEDYLQKSLTLAQKNSDVLLILIMMSLLGVVYYAHKEYKKAKEYLHQAIYLEKTHSIRIGARVFNYLTLALIARTEGNSKMAEKYFSFAKKENEHLQIKQNADKVYAMVFVLKHDLQKAGYYLFA